MNHYIPTKTWWQAMPWLVRAAIWFLALCVVVPFGAFVAVMSIAILGAI